MEQISKDKLPRHIAIIMDGNGRWAEKRSLNRIAGHRTGIKKAKDVIRYCRELGVQVLTLYAFSTENWKRPEREIKALMTLLKRFLRAEGEKLIQNNIRLNTIGNIDDLPADVAEVLKEVMLKTKNNTGMVLNAALSYSGRGEIIQAVKKIAYSKFPTRSNEEIRIRQSGCKEIARKHIFIYLFRRHFPLLDMTCNFLNRLYNFTPPTITQSCIEYHARIVFCL